MGKNILIAVTGLIVIVLVGVALSGGGNEAVMSQQDGEEAAAEEDTQQDEGTTFSGTLEELYMELGGSVRCTFTAADGAEELQEGVAYIDAQRVRVDANVLVEGVAYESHLIHDGETLYAWGDTPEGSVAIMFPVPEDGEMDDAEEEDAFGEGFFDSEAESEYDCDPWIVQESQFTPPEDVTFLNPLQAFEDLLSGNGAGSPAIDCSFCEGAPTEDDRAECRLALGC